MSEDDETDVIRRIADYEKISGIVWVTLGVLQTIAIVTAIAGVWNIFVGLSRFRIEKSIRARDVEVIPAFESLTGLVVIGLINLLLGAGFGLLAVGFDVFVRDQVLSRRALFTGATARRPLAGSAVERLEKLGRLKDLGILNDAEFNAEKARILASEV